MAHFRHRIKQCERLVVLAKLHNSLIFYKIHEFYHWPHFKDGSIRNWDLRKTLNWNIDLLIFTAVSCFKFCFEAIFNSLLRIYDKKCSKPKIFLAILLTTVKGMNSWATQLKIGCPRLWHYASHYHYGSQSIACFGQWECWAGWSQPINLHNIEHHIALLSEPTVYSLYCVLTLLHLCFTS